MRVIDAAAVALVDEIELALLVVLVLLRVERQTRGPRLCSRRRTRLRLRRSNRHRRSGTVFDTEKDPGLTGVQGFLGQALLLGGGCVIDRPCARSWARIAGPRSPGKGRPNAGVCGVTCE